ncbi:hypothetical protein ETU09_06865 [Apibacter muscae]|uniref:DUF5672 domain-containing protein n=1 Tax=Apibacter muscae TaxID=2509004 RepID=A0A563DCZ6_9FLAO|nr:DUF5672 family protein [Apibacter muscae]TWP27811.1 hypothetical protein ETU09_06865 [Apibacter muscae]
MKVKIIIPIYKTELSSIEKFSLDRCLNVFKNYTIVLVHPILLNLPKYIEFKGSNNIEKEVFDNSYFESVESYNRLLLSVEFYQRFKYLDYILIYQLDCYVFKDELLNRCTQGYDYIGAPWIFTSNILAKIKKKLNSKKYLIWYKTGNGGFSLRKIESSLKIVEELKREIEVYPYNEDVFWSIKVTKYMSDFKIPDYPISLKFAIDRKPKLALQLNNNELPFGCHGINKPKVINFWKKKLNFKES